MQSEGFKGFEDAPAQDCACVAHGYMLGRNWKYNRGAVEAACGVGSLDEVLDEQRRLWGRYQAGVKTGRLSFRGSRQRTQQGLTVECAEGTERVSAIMQ